MEEEHSTSIRDDLEKYKLAVTYASDHIIVTDPAGTIIFANDAASRTTGYSVKEMIGNKPSLWGGLMDRSFYAELWNTIAVEKKVFKGVLRNKRKTGEEYDAEIHVAPILDAQKQPIYYVGIERDVSEQKQLERARTHFLSLASHNLKTPLSSVRWFSEMLLANDAGKLLPEQRSFVEEIHTAAISMAELVRSLLNISRLELGVYECNPVEIDLTEIVQEVLELSRVRITQKSLTVHTVFEKDLPTTHMDRVMVTHLIENVISNAIKYDRENGALVVTVFKKKANEEVYGRYFHKDMLVIVVKDEGLGIPESEQGKVFEQFYRATNATLVDEDGTGLGLYLVRVIIGHMKGSVWFTSKKDEGTEFYIALPVVTK